VSHEQLWAPWRLGYILGDKGTVEPCDPEKLAAGADPTCFLCHAVAPGDDRQRLVIERREHTITVLNRFPYNNGHLLVAPRLHAARLDELSGETQLEISQTIARMVAVLETTMKPQGFNIGVNLGRAAGAGLPGHVHWHIVPRWIGDTNFMPILASVNTIPQALDAAWEVLTNELKGSNQCRTTP
jgi:ATP adenylyltransferase